MPISQNSTVRWDDLMLTTMASVAELEAGLISERTKAALKAAKAGGVRLGRHGAEVLAPQYRAEAHRRAQKLQPVIAGLKSKGLSLSKTAGRSQRRAVDGGITRQCGMCCNVSQIHADHRLPNIGKIRVRLELEHTMGPIPTPRGRQNLRWGVASTLRKQPCQV